MGDQFWHLKHCDLFERLSPEDVARVESRSKVRTFRRGDLIYLPNDSGSSLLLLTAGRVKIYHITSEGKEAVLAIIDPGEIFGELAVFDGGEREEFAQAMETSELILIPNDEIQRLMETYPEVSIRVTKLMGLRRKRVERRLKSLLFRSNRERLIHLLIELVEKYGRQTSDGVQIGIKLSHQELASIIGSTRETVTVILGDLQDENAVIVKRRQIILRNVDQLAAGIGLAPPELPAVGDPAAPPVARQTQYGA